MNVLDENIVSSESRMSQTIQLPPTGFDTLSVEEQIDYLQSLWNHIAAQPEHVPVPDWHREVLTERLAARHANPNDARTWEEFEHELTYDRQRQSNGS
jgi:putative addiction module component (TIGR02574 family)